MTIPSGSGTEILQRGWFADLSDTVIYAKFDGTISTTSSSNAVPTNNIITVLNINLTNMSSTLTSEVNIIVDYAGSTTIYLLKHSLPPQETFIYSEKLVLHPTDKLYFHTEGAAWIDVSFNYIRQNWV